MSAVPRDVPTWGQEKILEPNGVHRRAFPALDGQRGLATTEQLRAHGWTPDAIRHARNRTIQQVYPGVYISHRGPMGTHDRLVAAYLWAGDAAVLTGRVALDRHGLTVSSQGLCVFLVPSTRRGRRALDARTVRTTSAVTVAGYRDCVPLAGVTRALCDAAIHQGLAGQELEAVTISALQRRLIHPDRLQRELTHVRRSAVAPIRRGLTHFTKGAWSLPEARLAKLVRRAPDLPEFVANVELWTLDGVRIGCPDGYFPGLGVAIQVHSKAYHSGVDERGTDRWSATVEKDARFLEHGIVVVPLTPESIHRRPAQVLEALRRTAAAHAGRDMGHICLRQP